jgi:hypothetical protein
MIDQGFCFNVGEWNFLDAPLRGLYSRNCVYRGVIGMESFAPWIERLEKQMTERVLDGFLREIPPEWHARLRAHTAGQARTGRNEEPCLHRGTHQFQSSVEI